MITNALYKQRHEAQHRQAKTRHDLQHWIGHFSVHQCDIVSHSLKYAVAASLVTAAPPHLWLMQIMVWRAHLSLGRRASLNLRPLASAWARAVGHCLITTKCSLIVCACLLPNFFVLSSLVSAAVLFSAFGTLCLLVMDLQDKSLWHTWLTP